MANNQDSLTFTIDEMVDYIMFIEGDTHFWKMLETEIADLNDQQAIVNHATNRIRVWILNRKFDWEVVK